MGCGEQRTDPRSPQLNYRNALAAPTSSMTAIMSSTQFSTSRSSVATIPLDTAGTPKVKPDVDARTKRGDAGTAALEAHPTTDPLE